MAVKVILRSEAITLGLRTYFTGIPCKYGHIAERRIEGNCAECMRIHVRKHHRNNRSAMQEYEKENRVKRLAHVRAREARKLQAMPIWVDKEKIEAIYWKAWQKGIETGVEHHVDHIVPLRHPLVCGLHNEFNLQVITATANLQKGNSYGC